MKECVLILPPVNQSFFDLAARLIQQVISRAHPHLSDFEVSVRLAELFDFDKGSKAERIPHDCRYSYREQINFHHGLNPPELLGTTGVYRTYSLPKGRYKSLSKFPTVG